MTEFECVAPRLAKAHRQERDYQRRRAEEFRRGLISATVMAEEMRRGLQALGMSVRTAMEQMSAYVATVASWNECGRERGTCPTCNPTGAGFKPERA